MSLVMKKYRYNHKDYLVYERNLLAREFDANEWQTICNNDLGVGADFIIEIVNTQIFAYDMYGQKIDLNQDLQLVIDYHEGILKDNNILAQFTRNIDHRRWGRRLRRTSVLPEAKPWRRGGWAAPSNEIPKGTRKMETFCGAATWQTSTPPWRSKRP